MAQSIVVGQASDTFSTDLAFLVEGLVGTQVDNISAVVLLNLMKSGKYQISDTNRVYGNNGHTRIATAFAIVDSAKKILLINRDGNQQEIVNEGMDLSHAAATIHPASVVYKLGMMKKPEIFTILGKKIIKVQTAGDAVETITGNDEKECRMPVWLVFTDIEAGLPGFMDPQKVLDSKIHVTAKTAVACEALIQIQKSESNLF